MLITNHKVLTTILDSEGQQLVFTYVCNVWQREFFFSIFKQLANNLFLIFFFLGLFGKSAFIALMLHFYNFIQQRLIIVTTADPQFCHILTHSVVIRNDLLINDCFGEFGLLKHLFQVLIFFSQHTDQFVDIAFIDKRFILNLFSTHSITQRTQSLFQVVVRW